jgi:hypothetical protein
VSSEATDREWYTTWLGKKKNGAGAMQRNRELRNENETQAGLAEQPGATYRNIKNCLVYTKEYEM